MAFCEGCPVPGVLDQLIEGSGYFVKNQFTSSDELRKAAGEMVVSLSDIGDCEGLVDDFDILACGHSNANEMAMVGDLLELDQAIVAVDNPNLIDK